MSATGDIVQSYRSPRVVMRRHLARGISEGRVFIFLVAACLLVFIAQWPRLSREAFLDTTVPLEARLGAAMWGWLFVAPLIFYVIAWLSYLVARVIGGRGTAYGARLALFWSLLAVTPLWLLQGLVAGFIGEGPQLVVAGILLLAGFGWVWINSLIETQMRTEDE